MFQLENHYWIVAGSTTQVFSSASMSYVPVPDTTYESWLAGGKFPTRISAAADLYAVVKQVYLTQLAPLDVLLPRGCEDMITAYSLDATLLPSAQRTRLTQKATIRANIDALKTTLGV